MNGKRETSICPTSILMYTRHSRFVTEYYAVEGTLFLLSYSTFNLSNKEVSIILCSRFSRQ